MLGEDICGNLAEIDQSERMGTANRPHRFLSPRPNESLTFLFDTDQSRVDPACKARIVGRSKRSALP